MKYLVKGYDKNNNVIRTIVHENKYNDYVDNYKDDFYLRYICPLDLETDKRNDTVIILKQPIQNIIKITAKNLEREVK